MTETGMLDLPPTTWYRRTLEGADFSLEANTRAVPRRGRFYVLQRGKVVTSSTQFSEAAAAYQRLCEQFWTEHLAADTADERRAAAWGLLEIDPYNRDAGDVIRDEGRSGECRRLENMRRRRTAQRQHERKLLARRAAAPQTDAASTS